MEASFSSVLQRYAKGPLLLFHTLQLYNFVYSAFKSVGKVVVNYNRELATLTVAFEYCSISRVKFEVKVLDCLDFR